MKGLLKSVLACALPVLLSGCGGPWNDPYPADQGRGNILYSAFAERPKHLDPVQSYAENEYVFISQIYMPPLQYHYLKRPYELIPFAATEVPRPALHDASHRRLPDDAPAIQVAYSVYDIRIRPGIRYQPHPAFARDASGNFRYHALQPEDLRGIHDLRDFEHSGSRELRAEDYVFQIKRLAHPRLHSPIYGLMSEYVLGLKAYAGELARAAESLPEGGYLDLNQFALEGAEVLDDYTYRIRVKGKYPQFVYWLAMPFFAPVPWEAERFYAQAGMREGRNLSLDWHPVGTGPYMLTVHNPNRVMVLERNPNFSGETYPDEGEPGDREAGLLDDAGRPMPFIDKAVYSLERESIPYWNKFLQGYFDASGISSDSFDQTVQLSSSGEMVLTEDMGNRGIRLQTSVATSIYYVGFNMLDPVVGGDSERARKLRQAISIAMDQEEFISIFTNGRGIPGQGPVPPGIFGHRQGAEGVNTQVYDLVDGQARRKSIESARRLLAEAGYPNGIERASGRPLVIYFDTTMGGVGSKSRLDWLTKQFQKLELQLVVRSTDWNRFQDKVRRGTTQLFFMGWNADYPDPENFLSLFYGPHSRALTGGENAANYRNPQYDRLFEQVRAMENGAGRQALIDRMVDILRRDAPWIYMFYPKDFTLAHAWVHNRKPNKMASNNLKYQRIDPELRHSLRARWNRPVLWPLAAVLAVLAMLLLPAIHTWRKRERATASAPVAMP